MIPTHKGKPTGSGKASYWGIPFHGLVKNDLLYLPNGSTMSYDTPMNGSTVVIKNPGKSGLPPTRSLASYDAAQGFTWLTYCILAGFGKQVAGVALGLNAIIFVDHRDRPWLIRLNAPGGVFRLTVESRFGLLGSDPVSWVDNRLIYEGDFGQTITEYLYGDDICQNHDGSSVMLNTRELPISSAYLGKLIRVIEVNITSHDVIPDDEGTIDFVVSFTDYIATGDVDTLEENSIGVQPTGGHTCGTMEVTSREYHPDPLRNGWCGGYEIGVYDHHGSIDTVSAYTDHSWEYDYNALKKRVMKVMYGHDGLPLVLDVRMTTSIHQSTVASCTTILNAMYQVTTTVSDSGTTDGFGNPCGSDPFYQWSCSSISTGSYREDIQRDSTWAGGLYVNGVQMIGWHCSGARTQFSSGETDGSYSGSGSFTQGETPTYTAQFTEITQLIQNNDVGDLVVLLGDTTTDGNNGEQYYTTVIEGVSYIDDVNNTAITFDPTNAYLREYANNIFSLKYGDPTNPNLEEWYLPHWGLIADRLKVVSGELVDTTIHCSINPVDGEVTIDPDNVVCYV